MKTFSWGHERGLPVKSTSLTLKNNPTAIVESEKMDKALYQFVVDGKEVFGYKLTVNSRGQWIMEVKGGGDVIAVDKKVVTEVMPYTIAVQYKEGGTGYNYFNEARDLQVGDFFINAATFEPNGGIYQIGRVTDVDTKSKLAKSEIKYFKKL